MPYSEAFKPEFVAGNSCRISMVESLGRGSLGRLEEWLVRLLRIPRKYRNSAERLMKLLRPCLFSSSDMMSSDSVTGKFCITFYISVTGHRGQ